MAIAKDPIERLVKAFATLPGIGEKSALRMTYYLLREPPEKGGELASAITEVINKVRRCKECQTFTTSEICPICQDETRDKSTICVVGEVQDMLAIERSHFYRGLFHVLHGTIAPLDGVGPEALTINPLIERLKAGGINELIIATNTDTNGETTALYIARLAEPYVSKITRLASGLPRGGYLEYVDSATLQAALKFRHNLQ